jgi:NTP pyrophosphatase (non-canonical NTP hydrolase)
MDKYQQEIDKWFRDNNWQYWQPHEMLARLFEEGGELARLINHVYGPKKKKTEEADQNMKEEIGDIIYTLICIANSQGINLDEAVRASLDKVTSRDKDRYKDK